MALSTSDGSIIRAVCAALLAVSPFAVSAAPPASVFADSALLQSARAARVASSYGVITSIYRSPAHNRAVGGVANSYHLAGRAIDVARRPGVTHFQVAAVLRKAGYNLVESIDEGDHSHFAFSVPGVAVQAAGAASQPESAPETPKVRLVRADDHGELLLDLAPKPTLIAESANGSLVKSSR
jgi:hypothetical protein